jgi:hypothetical protein
MTPADTVAGRYRPPPRQAWRRSVRIIGRARTRYKAGSVEQYDQPMRAGLSPWRRLLVSLAGWINRGDREGRMPEFCTPKHLAERILRSKAAMEGERKLVSVLFADLEGLDGGDRRADWPTWGGRRVPWSRSRCPVAFLA